MRQRKPKRKSRLARSPLQRGQEPLKRRKPLVSKKPLTAKKGLARSTLKATTPLRTRARPAMKAAEREAAEEWRRKGLAACERKRALYVCPVCGGQFRDEQMEVHHVIAKQAIRKYVRSLRLPSVEARALLASLLWDPRNALALSERCHSAHTSAARRIPRRLLTRAHFAFAREIGLDWMLDRDYV